jgi:hypothetical protein
MRRRPPRQWRGWKTPASRVGLLPVLFALGVLLGDSPVGQAGFLWLHLATAHHELSRSPGVERHPDQDSTHPHPSEHHEPGRYEGEPTSGDDATENPDGSIAPGAPHEHDGVVHTHEQTQSEDSALPFNALSEFYLSPPVTLIPPLVRHGSRTPWVVPTPLQAAPRVETPPPRLPG